MIISRREFLSYCAGSAVTLGLGSVLAPLQRELAAARGVPVIWLKGSCCSGCTVSLANHIGKSSPADLNDLLIHTIDLAYHPVLMGAAGEAAINQLFDAASGKFILAVEGGIPTLYGGKTCTVYTHNGVDVSALDAIRELAPKAAHVLSIGTCASFGGLAAAQPNPTQVVSAAEASGVLTINIPGCPPHPDWIVWTLAQLLAGNLPPLDDKHRPIEFYGKTVHSQCSRKKQNWATTLSATGLCNMNLGCKGPQSFADCPTRKWNNGVNWCVGTISNTGNGADSLCVGCTEKGFPDKFAPLFSVMGATPEDHEVLSNETCMACHSSGRPD